jgi:hypothetical protein
MKTILTFAVVATCAVILLTGCAETLDPGEGGIGFHPADWATPGSANNHAAALGDKGLPNSAQDCEGCHGTEYGKPDPASDEPATDCFACHLTGGESGHPESGFILPSGAEFHGQKVIDEGGTDRCGHCHSWEFDGELDFDVGGWSQQACNVCHAGGRSGHPGAEVWFNPISPRFHGVAAAGADIAGCADCHGADYLGGWTELSCNTCHAAGAVPIHPNTWIGGVATPGTHGYLLTVQPPATEPELTDETCRGCHGADLQGGWSGRDCRPCHSF